MSAYCDDPSIQQIKQVVDALYPLPEEEWLAFAAIWQLFTAKRKTVLTRAGETEKYLYFITEGIQRIYYYDENDREATILFTYSPSFGGVLDSFLLRQPSAYYFETITQSGLLRASWQDLSPLLEKYPSIGRMMLKGVTIALSGLLERLAELQSLPSEEKFRRLLKRSPHILGLVPQKYLANYLGMDATNFSKLVNRIKI